MTSRPYAQIECSLTDSKKLRRLSSASARWAYISTHLSGHCTYSGLFQYPLHLWSHDAQITLSELPDVIAELVAAGLIEYDSTEDWVRIVGWFRKKNCPENPNRVISVAADLTTLDAPPEMFVASIAELSVGTVKLSLGWKPDSAARPQLAQTLRELLGDAHFDYGDEVLDAVRRELASQSRRVASELGSIFPPLTVRRVNPSATLPEPLGNPIETLDEDETRRDQDEDQTKKRQNQTGPALNFLHHRNDGDNFEVGTFAEKRSQVAMPHPETIEAAKKMAGGQ